MANPTEVFRNRQPIFLTLKEDFQVAFTSSHRMKRAVADHEELEVFAAEQYISGALDKLKPCKTSPEKEFYLRPPATSSALWEPAKDSFRAWRPPIESLISCFRRAPSPEDNHHHFQKTTWSTQKWDEKSKNTKNLKIKRSLHTARVDSDTEIFSDSSSDLFELDTLSIRACPSVVDKSPKYCSAGDGIGEITAAPAERGLVQASCWGSNSIDVAVGIHGKPKKHRSKK